MLSLALTLRKEGYLLEHVGEKCPFPWLSGDAFGGMGACLVECWLSPSGSGCGLVTEMQLGGTWVHLHKAASDYLLSASITINFMWSELPSNSFFLQTDFLNTIGHGAVCDFVSAESNPFLPCRCLFLWLEASSCL